MILASDLRIGNWVQRIGWPLQIVGIKGTDIWLDSKGYEFEHYFYDGINPIPITEDWLLKLGFHETQRMAKYVEFSINNDYFLRLPICKHLEKDYWYALRGEVKIKYVHQLQNLYHALTGEEL